MDSMKSASTLERVYAPNESTRETVVEDLWREGWFRATSRSLANGVSTLDAEDMASEAAIVAQRSADSWNGEGELQAWVKWRARNYMLTVTHRHIGKLKRVSDISVHDFLPGTIDPVVDKIAESAPSAELELEMAAWEDAASLIAQAIEVLTPNQREYVKLRFFQDSANKFADDHVSYKHLTSAWPGARKKLSALLGELKWMVRE